MITWIATSESPLLLNFHVPLINPPLSLFIFPPPMCNISIYPPWEPTPCYHYSYFPLLCVIFPAPWDSCGGRGVVFWWHWSPTGREQVQETRRLSSEVLGETEQICTDVPLERSCKTLCHTADTKCKHSNCCTCMYKPHPLKINV